MAAAGAGGGAEAAVAVPPIEGERIADFITMLMPRLEEEHKTNEFVHLCVAHMTRPQIDYATIDFIMRRMQAMPEPLREAIIDSGHAGSYGRLYFCGINNRRCYKSIVMPVGGGPRLYALCSEIIKESFIQFILSSDPIHGSGIPQIFNIYQATIPSPAGVRQNTIMIEMERSGTSVYSAFMGIVAPIRFDQFYEITFPIFTLLFELNQRYLFVHRDLKLDNILRRLPDDNLNHEGNIMMPAAAGAGGAAAPAPAPARQQFQIIDFGMSCITINLDGRIYVIKSTSFYRHEVPCRQQQDVVTYITAFQHLFTERSEPRLVGFLRNFFPYNLHLLIEAKRRRTGQSYFHAGYNADGVLLAPPERQRLLTIYYFLEQLNAEFARGQVGGRALRKRRRTRRRK